jgi:hypothetical protein
MSRVRLEDFLPYRASLTLRTRTSSQAMPWGPNMLLKTLHKLQALKSKDRAENRRVPQPIMPVMCGEWGKVACMGEDDQLRI